MAKQVKTAISPTRAEDYPEWYQQVVKASDMAENSPVRKPMGRSSVYKFISSGRKPMGTAIEKQGGICSTLVYKLMW